MKDLLASLWSEKRDLALVALVVGILLVLFVPVPSPLLDFLLVINISLALLILLALGTIVAGVHARAWRVGLVGLFLALAVPAVAWIQESVMLLLVGVLLMAVIGFAFWWAWQRGDERP